MLDSLREQIAIKPGFSKTDFKRIAHNGFGDGINAYAHSMAWFKNKLYVATTRGNFPLMRARLPIAMNPWPVECPENPFDLDLHAEIWCYSVTEDAWERVFKAPTITGSHGKPIPRELGYRGMCVYIEPDGTEALYISTWSPAKGPGPLLLRTIDGKQFIPSCEPGLIGLPVTTIRTMTCHKGKMYTTPAGSRGGNPNISAHSIVYESENPAEGQWHPVSEFGFGDPENKTVFEIYSFGEHIYVGTFNLAGYQVWRSDCEGEKPYQWECVVEQGAYRGVLNQAVLSMCAFKGALYVGSAIQGGGIDRQNKVGPAPPELIRIYKNGEWDLIVGESRHTPVGYKKALSGYTAGFDNFFNGYFWRQCEHDGWLYLSTFDWSSLLGYAERDQWPQSVVNIVNDIGEENILNNQSGFDLYRSFDGENWLPVTKNGMENPYNLGMRTIVSTPRGLFLGTANPFGPKVWPLGGDSYVNNPKGGCEVYFAKHK